MTLDQLTELFKWMTICNVAVFLISAVLTIMFKGFVCRMHGMIFGIDKEKLAGAKKDVLIMHPGPTNRGVELSAEIADGEYSVILDQVTNGLAIRMAILYLLLGTKEPAIVES